MLPWIAWLGIKHRGLGKVTAANPGLPAGGFVGESKSEILETLGTEHPEIPEFVLLRADEEPTERVARARAFAETVGCPVFLKPDAGQRGSGVVKLQDLDDVERHAASLSLNSILQENVEGLEYGVFWVEEPEAPSGRIFSITTKELPTVVGDGKHTIEELLLADPRARAMHKAYLSELGQDAEAVLPEGESRRLVEVGTHARGAVFLDGAHLITPELTEAVGRIAARFEGFHFGRFDFMAPSPEDLKSGRNLRVIELNGVTSESTNVYDPKFSGIAAYGILLKQWTIAYRIGAHHASKGAPTTGLIGILRAFHAYRKTQGDHIHVPNEILSKP